jgi:hypothetical protein
LRGRIIEAIYSTNVVTAKNATVADIGMLSDERNMMRPMRNRATARFMTTGRHSTYQCWYMPLINTSETKMSDMGTFLRSARNKGHKMVQPLFCDYGEKGTHQAKRKACKPKSVHPYI